MARLHAARAAAAAALCAVAAALQLGAAVPAAAQQSTSVPPLVPTGVTHLDSRLVELSFADPLTSPPMAQVRVRILLPGDYASSDINYPVLYLLHGAGDTAAAWTDNADGQQPLEAFTANAPVVIVMPDGGANLDAGWYSDWFNAGAFGPPMWETFHIEQLIDWVQSNYRVRTDRGGRAVAGLSMGGFGAFSYAARHPDLFCAAFSFSGFLDTGGIPYLEPAALAALHSMNGTPTDAVWGSWNDDEIRWRGHNPADLVANLHDVPLWMTTGMGAPGGPSPQDGDPAGLATEAAVFSTNQSFDAKAQLAGITPQFTPYPQGGHNWWHWQDDLHRAWPLVMSSFTAAPDAETPPSFDYESIEPSFTVWGWSVAMQRDVTEFLTLQHAGANGLTLTGSGSVALTTPPAYTPHHAYAITVSGGPTASTSTPLAVADGSGRLHIGVTLGPSHTLQQDTAQERAAEAADPGYWETAGVSITPAHGHAATLAPQSAAAATLASLPDTAATSGGGAGAASIAGCILLLPRMARRRRSIACRRSCPTTPGRR